MSFILLRGKQSIAVILSVLLTTLVVALVAHGITYVNTSSVGVATDTPGAALSVKGQGIFEGFVSAGYFTSTSTNPSWVFGKLGVSTTTPGVGVSVKGAGLFEGFVSAGYFTSTSTSASWIFGNLGIGTTTPGAGLGVRSDNNDVAGNLTVESSLKTSFFTATSTTATSTLSSYGSSLASTTITIDGQSGRMAIGSTTVPDADASSGMVDPALTIAGQGAASTATGTLYISGGSTGGGGQIIIRSSNGRMCVAISANTGANAADASGTDATNLLTAKVVVCPK